MARANPRQFPTKSRIRQYGPLWVTISYGFPGKRGIAVALCWRRVPKWDVTGTWRASNGTYKYVIDWRDVHAVMADIHANAESA